jgi:hypothetical protein
MEKSLFFIIFILCVSCLQEKQKPVEKKAITPFVAVKKQVEINDSISGFINPKLNKFSFKFNVDYLRNNLIDIKIYEDSSLIQVIDANKDLLGYEFKLIDWNFDGYKDITVLFNCGSGGCAYYIWNYSPKQKKFVYNSILSEVLGLKIDSVSQHIIFHYRAGYSEENADTFKCVKDKLVFQKGMYYERWIDQDNNFWEKKTHTKVINGKIVYSIDSMLIR